MYNRCLLGEGRGFMQCLDIIDRTRPDMIINQHQPLPFVYTPEEIMYLRETLQARAAILAELSPWPAADFLLDPCWLRLFPYASQAKAGVPLDMELQITSHKAGLRLEVCLNVYGGTITPSRVELTHPTPTCGYVTDETNGDLSIPLALLPDQDAKTAVVTAEVWVDGTYYGELCRCVSVISV